MLSFGLIRPLTRLMPHFAFGSNPLWQPFARHFSILPFPSHSPASSLAFSPGLSLTDLPHPLNSQRPKRICYFSHAIDIFGPKATFVIYTSYSHIASVKSNIVATGYHAVDGSRDDISASRLFITHHPPSQHPQDLYFNFTSSGTPHHFLPHTPGIRCHHSSGKQNVAGASGSCSSRLLPWHLFSFTPSLFLASFFLLIWSLLRNLLCLSTHTHPWLPTQERHIDPSIHLSCSVPLEMGSSYASCAHNATRPWRSSG
ncbi:hypothetical protein H4582DRAFT_1099670 [Lactarius indigo]|nr:hypothetical protein H4582DRAFT_1099670 [Lactarius indigo]